MPIPTSPHIQNLLDRLHAQSLEQEHVLAKEGMGEADFDTYMKDKFIALEQDKCEFVYTLARATGAKTIIEAGTSFGVSTIYLALAVSANTASGGTGRVIATENEPSKATIAMQNWKEAGEEVERVIELREGDLRETLQVDLPTVDMLLLDIWAPLAFPTLQVVLSKLRPGAVVITDNTIGSAARYKDLLEFLRDPKNKFINQTLPYHNGLEVSVYSP